MYIATQISLVIQVKDLFVNTDREKGRLNQEEERYSVRAILMRGNKQYFYFNMHWLPRETGLIFFYPREVHQP